MRKTHLKMVILGGSGLAPPNGTGNQPGAEPSAWRITLPSAKRTKTDVMQFQRAATKIAPAAPANERALAWITV